MNIVHSGVVVVGSFNLDHVWHSSALPRAGETLQGKYHTGPGGKGFNQATAAVRAGAKTVFVCALGNDAAGDTARELSAREGIDLRALAASAPTGTAGIYVDDAGRNTIVIGAGANAELSDTHVAAQSQAIATAKVVLTQLESPLPCVLEAMRLARAAGIKTMLNPAPANADCLRELLAVTDVLTPNETEFAALLARHTSERIDPDTIATSDDSRLHRLCRTLLPRGTVVITLGAAGVFVSHRADKTRGDTSDGYRLAAETAEAIDTTGAGDAFNGALAASLSHTPNTIFADHLRFAIRFAALSTERRGGAASMPTQAQVLARYGSD